VRPRTSDIDVFRQIFVEQEYSFLDDVADVRTIIDCGANIGCSSRWFLEMHQRARVVAVEPDPANVAQLKLNLAPFAARAIIIQGAVWSHTSSLIVVRGVFGDGREWATQVRKCGVNELPDLSGHSMSDLVSMFEEPTVDILKIDIEGAEEQVFGRGDLSWVSRVRTAVIEIHAQVNKDLIYRAFPEGLYTRARSGELTGFKKLPTH
jgi:FkbM family methyltransferase